MIALQEASDKVVVEFRRARVVEYVSIIEVVDAITTGDHSLPESC